MANPVTPRKLPPSPWAVGLLVACSAFAALSVALVSSGYSPL